MRKVVATRMLCTRATVFCSLKEKYMVPML